ncbi:MAG: hypothetical protein Ct9H90mP27_3010 [Gammaproteobacteria bacterium]|nr:MAG: hypothetical protein Ct9H90mP27_3010 [Gammaproteobacteria bacterium]
MSNAPYLVQKARSGLRMGHQQMQDALFLDGLEDAETGGSMGSFAKVRLTSSNYQKRYGRLRDQLVVRARAASKINF